MNSMAEMAVDRTCANDMPQPDDHLLRMVERHDELQQRCNSLCDKEHGHRAKSMAQPDLEKASLDLMAIADTLKIVFEHHAPDQNADYSGPLAFLMDILQEKTYDLYYRIPIK